MRTALFVLALALLAPAAPAAADEPAPATSLPDVTVVETRTPRTVESLTGSGDVISRDELDVMDARTLEEAIRQLPGVDVVGAARYGQEVRVNTRGIPSGYGTQRTLVLLDGRPITDEYLGNVDLAQYPLGAMRQVELVRGPASSAYGTNALGGVVNLVPRRGSETPFTEIAGEGGSFGSTRFALSHGTMLGPVDLFLSVERTETNGYLENSAGDDMDWSTGDGFVNLGYGEERFDVRGYFYAFGGQGTDEDFDRDLDRHLEDLLFTYRLDPAKDADTKVRVYRSQLAQRLDWFARPVSDYDLVSWGAILTQSYRVHGDHLLLGGVEWRLEEAQVGEAAGDVDERATTWSAFAQDEWRAHPDVSVVAGVRYDKRSRIDGEVTFRAGANWRVTEDTTVRGAVSRAFRAPTISDQYLPRTGYFGVFFEGNPSLDPEYATSAELGVDHRVLPWLRGSATAFASRYDDFWDFLFDGATTFRPMNIGRVRIWGAEVEVGADLPYGLEATVSYTLTNAEYRDFDPDADVEGNRLDDNVKHRGTASIVYRHPAGHTARLGLLVSGDRYTDPENTHDGKLDGFYVLDLQVEGKLTDWATVTLNVQNALNHGYRTRQEYRQPGRAIFGGLRLSF